MGCQDGSIIMLDIRTLNQKIGDRTVPLETLKGQIGDIRNLVFDSKRRRLLASGSTAQIDEWYVPTGTELMTRQSLAGQIQETVDSISKAPSADPSAATPKLTELLRSLESLRVLADDHDRWD